MPGLHRTRRTTHHVLTVPTRPQPPIRCLLELRYDGTLTLTRQAGCTEEDVYDILRLLTQSNGPFDHVTILPNPGSSLQMPAQE